MGSEAAAATASLLQLLKGSLELADVSACDAHHARTKKRREAGEGTQGVGSRQQAAGSRRGPDREARNVPTISLTSEPFL